MPVDVVLGLPDPDNSAETYDGYVEKLQERMRESYKFVRQEIGKSAERNKRYYDLRVKSRKYSVGDWVSYFNPRHFRGRQDKWSRKYSAPFLVVAVTSPVNVKLQKSKKSKPFITHIDKVKPYLAENMPNSWLEDVPQSAEPDAATTDVPTQEDVAQAGNDEIQAESEGNESEVGDDVAEALDLQDQPCSAEQNAESEFQLSNDASRESTESPKLGGQSADSGSQQEEIQGYEVDERHQPRPRREIRLPARYRD
jgi:hypothetical protein